MRKNLFLSCTWELLENQFIAHISKSQNLSEKDFREVLEEIFLPEQQIEDDDAEKTLDSKDNGPDPSDRDMVSDQR